MFSGKPKHNSKIVANSEILKTKTHKSVHCEWQILKEQWPTSVQNRCWWWWWWQQHQQQQQQKIEKNKMYAGTFRSSSHSRSTAHPTAPFSNSLLFFTPLSTNSLRINTFNCRQTYIYTWATKHKNGVYYCMCVCVCGISKVIKLTIHYIVHTHIYIYFLWQ